MQLSQVFPTCTIAIVSGWGYLGREPDRHGYHERSRDEVGLHGRLFSGRLERRQGLEIQEKPNVGSGGQGRNRTADASLFRAALYQLSYLAIFGRFAGRKTSL
jgi:hypothetical protein